SALETIAVLLAVTVVWVTAVALTPTAYGDAGEYFLMAESLFNHATPDARPADMNSLAAVGRTHPLGGSFGPVLTTYRTTADGRWYSIHFWGFPLATLPVKALLHLLRANEFKAPQITNALLFIACLLAAWRDRSFSPGQRWLLAALIATS